MVKEGAELWRMGLVEGGGERRDSQPAVEGGIPAVEMWVCYGRERL